MDGHLQEVARSLASAFHPGLIFLSFPPLIKSFLLNNQKEINPRSPKIQPF